MVEGDLVRFTYRHYTLKSDELLGVITSNAVVTRVWDNAPYVTLVTDDDKTFVRRFDSPSIEKL